MATYTNIGNQITTANNVNNYNRVNPPGYPAINVEAYDGNGVFADTTRNRREFIFRITIMQERVKVSHSEAERICRTLVDQVLSTFDNRTNFNLNNSCDFATPVPSKWGYIQSPEIDVRTAEVLLVAVALA
jgi:hypothetical protein